MIEPSPDAPREPPGATEVRTLIADPVERTNLGAPAAAVSELALGEVLGRYVVVARIGQGGMGVVYAAYDPELERRVAIKLLLGDGDHGAGARFRMLREAQAMAKLSHPNVIAIHDVGTHGDRVWLAMEFVSGQTMSSWLHSQPRSWREVVSVLVCAGEGLAAAHAAGLIHRDFKPDNVMVGDDGRVRVMDFGLARADLIGGTITGSELEAAAASSLSLSQSRPLETSVTQLGVLIGTPRYMAPEQWEHKTIDARTDQFAFCVAAWEALYRESPFFGSSPGELALAITGGKIQEPPAHARVPGRLRQVLRRGLAVHPDQRWPRMDVLLAELRKDPTRRRRIVLTTAAVSLAIAGGLAGWQLDHTRRIDACEAAAGALTEIWNPSVAAEVRDQMLATEAPFAAASFTNLVPWLDRYAAAWAQARRQGCLRATVDRTLDPASHASLETCLAERQAELGEFLGVLAAADREVVQHAVVAAASLPDLHACADDRLLARREPTPTVADGEAKAVRDALARVTALRLAGEAKAAADEATAAAVRAEEFGLTVLLARARLAGGSAQLDLGDYKEAREQLEQAVYGAGAAGADEVAAEAAIQLVGLVGKKLAQTDAGAAWSQAAEMWLTRIGAADDDVRRASLLDRQGDLAVERAAYADAQALYERSAAQYEATLGPEHPTVALMWGKIGEIVRTRGDFPAALAYQQRSLALLEQLLGADHPDVATALAALGYVQYQMHTNDEARENFLRALAIRERGLNPQHPAIGDVLNSLAILSITAGDFREGLAYLGRSKTIREQSLGPGHPDVAKSLSNMGVAHTRLKEYDQALASFRQSLAIREKALGPDHPELAFTLRAYGNTLLILKDYDGAYAAHARALALDEKALGKDHPHIPHSMGGMATAELERGHLDEAAALFEQVLALATRHKADPADLAHYRFSLARSLIDRDRARALALAHEARAEFDQLSALELARDNRATVDQWLAEHDRGSQRRAP